MPTSAQVVQLKMSLAHPKISILLATFNGARHLASQLHSLKDQSYQNWELFVSDDGSEDNTIEIVCDFAREVPQRVVIVEGPRQGFWRNFLSLLRRTDIFSSPEALLAFCDQDDVWFSNKLSRAAAWFSSRPPDVPALYFSRTQLMNEEGEIIGLSPLFTRPTSFRNALVQSIGGGNTIVLNRAAGELLARAPHDITIVSHDWWAYQVVTGAGGDAFYDPDPTINYRQHAKNLVGGNRGVKARLVRSLAFGGGRMRKWNEINTTALAQLKPVLSADAQRTLELFSSARTSCLPQRLFLLWRSGVYRQGILETLGLFLGATLRLI